MSRWPYSSNWQAVQSAVLTDSSRSEQWRTSLLSSCTLLSDSPYPRLVEWPVNRVDSLRGRTRRSLVAASKKTPFFARKSSMLRHCGQRPHCWSVGKVLRWCQRWEREERPDAWQSSLYSDLLRRITRRVWRRETSRTIIGEVKLKETDLGGFYRCVGAEDQRSERTENDPMKFRTIETKHFEEGWQRKGSILGFFVLLHCTRGVRRTPFRCQTDSTFRFTIMVLLLPFLTGHQSMIQTVLLHQSIVCFTFDQLALIQGHDHIAISDATQTMGNDNRCSVSFRSMQQIFDHSFTEIVWWRIEQLSRWDRPLCPRHWLLHPAGESGNSRSMIEQEPLGDEHQHRNHSSSALMTSLLLTTTESFDGQWLIILNDNGRDDDEGKTDEHREDRPSWQQRSLPRPWHSVCSDECFLR